MDTSINPITVVGTNTFTASNFTLPSSATAAMVTNNTMTTATTTTTPALVKGTPYRDNTTAGIFSIDISIVIDTTTGWISLSKTRRESQFLDEEGVSHLHGACYMPGTRELVVGRSSGVFSYSPDDRGGATGLEGKKSYIQCLKNYILIAHTNSTTTNTTSAATTTNNNNNSIASYTSTSSLNMMVNTGTMGGDDSISVLSRFSALGNTTSLGSSNHGSVSLQDAMATTNTNTSSVDVIIYDLRNKFIAGSLQLVSRFVII